MPSGMALFFDNYLLFVNKKLLTNMNSYAILSAKEGEYIYAG